MPERAGEVLSPLGRMFVGGPAQARRARDRVHDADRQRLSPLPAEFAGARSRHLVLRPSRRDDPRARRRRAIRRPGSRTASASPPANPYLFIMSQIVAGLDGVANALDPGPQNDEPYAERPAAAAEEPRRRRSMRSSASRCFARSSAMCSSTISSSSSATRPAASSAGWRRAACKPAGRRNDRMGAAGVFRFFLARRRVGIRRVDAPSRRDPARQCGPRLIVGMLRLPTLRKMGMIRHARKNQRPVDPPDGRRRPLRLGRTGPGGSRPSPDLHRSGDLRGGD